MTKEPKGDGAQAPASAEDKKAKAPASPEHALPPEHARPKEVGGRDGPDPVRYGDWEKGGIAVDF